GALRNAQLHHASPRQRRPRLRVGRRPELIEEGQARRLLTLGGLGGLQPIALRQRQPRPLEARFGQSRVLRRLLPRSLQVEGPLPVRREVRRLLGRLLVKLPLPRTPLALG